MSDRLDETKTERKILGHLALSWVVYSNINISFIIMIEKFATKPRIEFSLFFLKLRMLTSASPGTTSAAVVIGRERKVQEINF